MAWYAYHLPTRKFSREEFEAMPLLEDIGQLGPQGYSKWLDRAGKVAVTHLDHDNWRASYAVRPIVVCRVGT